MTDSRLKLILSTCTNLAFGGVISAAWLMGKVSTETALLPLLALAGLDVLGRRNENRLSGAPEAPSASKPGYPLPPPGPTAAALLMALQSLQGMF